MTPSSYRYPSIRYETRHLRFNETDFRDCKLLNIHSMVLYQLLPSSLFEDVLFWLSVIIMLIEPVLEVSLFLLIG